jgi:DNA-binding NarL/FixJ family response regulator
MGIEVGQGCATAHGPASLLATKPRILFVDDDALVLEGLRKALRKYRERWDTVFALGGPAGLDEVRRTTFDVVVSDMRMPELDGVALLGHVRDRDPSTIRIVLSGYSEHRAVMRAPPIAHHFLDKPCGSKELIEVIERACAVRGLFVGEPLRTLGGRIATLPSPLIETAIARVIEQDSALCAGILKLASSAYFAFERPLTSIADAVSHIGVDLIAAFAFATSSPDGATSQAFTTNLVHDIGKIVIAIAMPEQNAAILRRLEEPGALRSSLERELLGTTHTEVGAYLLTLWGLPLSTIAAVARDVDVTTSEMASPPRMISA